MDRRTVILSATGACFAAGWGAVFVGIANNIVPLSIAGAAAAALAAVGYVFLLVAQKRAEPPAMPEDRGPAIRIGKAGKVVLEDNEHSGSLYASDETGELLARRNRDTSK
jgi:hypothetical protein